MKNVVDVKSKIGNGYMKYMCNHFTDRKHKLIGIKA